MFSIVHGIWKVESEVHATRRSDSPRGRIISALIIACVALGISTPLSAQVSSPRPQQHVVFVIDNSGSMEGNPPADPLRLRGVAASLILDALELASDVKAGLVFFSDRAESDGQLHDPELIRRRVQADKLPNASGGTNLEAALERAINLLSGSTAPSKRIILITDGVPAVAQTVGVTTGGDSAAQRKAILDTLVLQASRAGIEIHALGLSRQIDEAFLNQVTSATGGRTVVSDTHEVLLERAKELVGQGDDVFTLVHDRIPGTQPEVEIELPPGVSRARITAILDSPNIFAPDELELELSGPDGGDGGRRYLVTDQGTSRVAAWTAFISRSGRYTLRLTVNKPGYGQDHLGLHLFVEALSVLDVELVLSPPGQSGFAFDDEVKVKVVAATGTTALDPAVVQVTGSVITPDGAAAPIAFSGLEGLFTVPAVAGRHTLEVDVQTTEQFVRRKAKLVYQAVEPESAELVASRPELSFTTPLSPEAPEIEEAFELFAQFPDGTRQRPVRVSLTGSCPGLYCELIRKDGGELKMNGAHSMTIPKDGLALRLKVRFDASRPIGDDQQGEHRGELRFFADNAGELVVPFRLQLRRPRFEVTASPDEVALWWDPHQPRTIAYGRLVTDLVTDSAFEVSTPHSLAAFEGGPEWLGLALLIDGQVQEPQRNEGGRLHYGPFDLPAGRRVDLGLRLSPRPEIDWRSLDVSSRPLEVLLTSSLGMEERVETTVWNAGGSWASLPFAGPGSRHGRYGLTWLILLPSLALVTYLFWYRLTVLRRFWAFRPGSTCDLPAGVLAIGDSGFDGDGLLLPEAGSELDGSEVARVEVRGGAQRILDRSGGHLRISERRLEAPHRLRSGDLIGIADPDDPQERLWELEYLDYLPETGGELEVMSSSMPVSPGLTLRKLATGLIVLWGIRWLLGLGWVGQLAYRVPFLERFYSQVLLP